MSGPFISIILRELTTWYSIGALYTDGCTRPVAGILGILELLYGTRDQLNEEQLNYIRQIFGSLNSHVFSHSLPLVKCLCFGTSSTSTRLLSARKINSGCLEPDPRTMSLVPRLISLSTVRASTKSDHKKKFRFDITPESTLNHHELDLLPCMIYIGRMQK